MSPSDSIALKANFLSANSLIIKHSNLQSCDSIYHWQLNFNLIFAYRLPRQNGQTDKTSSLQRYTHQRHSLLRRVSSPYERHLTEDTKSKRAVVHTRGSGKSWMRTRVKNRYLILPFWDNLGRAHMTYGIRRRSTN